MKVPKHIAIIMDGNGRWADKRFLPKIAGHTKGVLAVERTIKACTDLGVKVLTLYTFSTENWKRSKKEVNALMGLLQLYLNKKAQELKKNGVKLIVSGDVEGLPEKVVETIQHVADLTKDNKKLILNLALNYGARQEIIMAVKEIAGLVKKKKINIDDIDQKLFSDKLYSSSLPDPELVIRTSGEMRISNFLLWQISYSEFYVTKTLWPDFGKKDLEKAIEELNKRQRRFGGR